MQGHWTDESLHEELAGEGENDNVEGHKSKVFGSFAVVGYVTAIAGVVWDVRVVGREGVG